jgi:chorismate mutase/prephenate dehydratase
VAVAHGVEDLLERRAREEAQRVAERGERVQRRLLAVRAWRASIDAIDEAIVALLGERAELALRAGRAKRATGQPIYCAAREADVVARVSAADAGPLDGDAVARVFEAIMRETRAVQARNVA